MSPLLAKGNVRLRLAVLAMMLVTLYSWRAGWKESMFDAFCMAILAIVSAFTGAHTFEAVKKPVVTGEVK